MNECPICSSTRLGLQTVLWPELIEQWELTAIEVEYINRQQGFFCQDCGNNLRSMALAFSILKSYGVSGNFVDAMKHGDINRLSVLEVNHAGGLTATLSELPGHQLINYPEYDLQDLDILSSKYDLVIHSDTLEHVADPCKALRECRRILKDNGRCIFTVPIILDRMSRSRHGLPPSYHGVASTGEHDLLVHTEFGADIWEYVFRAGFGSCKLYSLEYPAGMAIEAMS